MNFNEQIAARNAEMAQIKTSLRADLERHHSMQNHRHATALFNKAWSVGRGDPTEVAGAYADGVGFVKAVAILAED